VADGSAPTEDRPSDSLIAGDSSWRRRWDVLLLVASFATAILIPYAAVFEHGWPLLVAIYAIDVFFIAGVAVERRTTFYRRGIEVVAAGEIRKRVASRWWLHAASNAPIELIVVALGDWTLAAAGSAVALLRVNRLLRIWQLVRVFQSMRRRRRSRAGLIRVAEYVSILGILIHWTACLWFYIPYAEGVPDDSWLATAGLAGEVGWRGYLRSLYWVVTTVSTVGFGDIAPARDLEYAVSIFVMLMGASMYAFMIGTVASVVSNMDSARTHFYDRVETVGRYLESRNIPVELGQRLYRYYDYLWERHRGFAGERLMEELPQPLRLELLLASSKEFLERVPLFAHCPEMLRGELLLRLRPMVLGPDITFIRAGELPRQVYFVSSGCIDVLDCDGKTVETFSGGDDFGLLSLMLEERRSASLRTTTFCEFLVLDAAALEELKAEFPEFKDVLRRVASERSGKLADLVLEGITL
jgi:hypothetical protein